MAERLSLDDGRTTAPRPIPGTRARRARAIRLALPFVAATAFVAYLGLAVPVRNLAMLPHLPRGQVGRFWPVALVGLMVVLAADAWLIRAGRRSGRSTAHAEVVSHAVPPGRPMTLPEPLRFQVLPGWAVGGMALVSGGLVAAGMIRRWPPWVTALGALVPWVPVFVVEEVARFRRYGFYAVMFAIAVLQAGHLAEHTVQVGQLLAHGGDLASSHGVFGRLDFELVHFLWDTAVWIGGGLLVYRFWGNGWLWFSWAMASLHQVEHIYLFWVNRADLDFYERGGIAGIFGQGGLIGSPLARPYLHFAYNFLVVVPMLIGFWRETTRTEQRTPAQIRPRDPRRPGGGRRGAGPPVETDGYVSTFAK